MSELKDYKVYTTRNEGAWGYHYEPNPNKDQSDIELNGELVYLKKDVDKVIAGKDAEIAELKKQISEERSAKVDYKISAHDLSDGLKEAYEELWHQKYKRCLNMAWWCNVKGDWYYSLGELFKSVDDDWRRGLCEAFRKHVDFYIKWRDKWFKIAERFKEKPSW